MADKENYGGLASAVDLSKVNTYGLDDESYHDDAQGNGTGSKSRLQELQQAQQDAYNALQQRYQQPNWFKVAAGFAKPQLGGFTASLGSAADALGDTVDEQRAQQLPMAEMKMRIAQSNLLLGQNKKASDMVAARRDNGLPITPEFAAEIARIAPDSAVAKALSTEIGTQQKEQELAGQRIAVARSMGNEPNPADMALFAKSTAPGSPPNPPGGGQNVQPPAGGNQQPAGGNQQPAGGNQQPVEQAPTGGKTGSVSNEDFLNATHGLENIPPGQKAKPSSAMGPGGMLDSTRANLQKKYNLPDGYGTDPAVTSQYENALLKENAETILKPNNMDETTLNHRMAWWFGNDAPKLTSSDPSSKIGEVLSPQVIKSNGLDPNMRVGKLVSRIEGNLWDQGINPKNMVGGAQSQENPTALPLNPSDPKPNQNPSFNDWGFANVPANATYNDFTKNQYKNLEDNAQNRLKIVQDLGAPEGNVQTNAAQNISALLNFAQASPENREAIKRVVNTMNKYPPLMNALLSSGDAGLHANIGDFSGSIGAPFKKFLENFNDPKDQKVAQMVALAIDNANFVNAKIKGMSPTANIPAAEANLMTSGALSRDINYSTLINSMSHLENNLNMQKNLFNGYQSLTNSYGDKLSPLAPTHQIVNSKWWNGVVKYYNDKSDAYYNQYNKAMGYSPK